MDLSLPSAPIKVFQEIDSRDLKIDTLVNSAGFGLYGQFSENPWEAEAKMIQVNATTLTHLTKLFLPHLIDRRGRILNIASTAAFQPGPLMAVYFATKAYVLSFSEALANELKGVGVQVTTLCPGPTQSSFQETATMDRSKLVKDRNLPTAREVAGFGFDALMRGKGVVVHGRINWLLANGSRFLPRRLVTQIVRRLAENG